MLSPDELSTRACIYTLHTATVALLVLNDSEIRLLQCSITAILQEDTAADASYPSGTYWLISILEDESERASPIFR